MILAALFDMDGLMIDSDRIISQSYETVLKEHGKEPIPNSRGIVHTPGISALDNWRNLIRKYDLDADINELVEKKGRLHAEYMRKGVDPKPGLIACLNLFQKHNIKMAVASSSRRELIDDVLQNLNITHYFNAVVSGNEVASGKPAPDIFLLAAKKLRAEPRNCVVLEDAIDGIRAGKSAHMTTIAIPVKSDTDNQDFQIADAVFPSLDKISWKTITSLSSQK